MDRYYYLAAELPFLVFNKRPQISSKDFLEEIKDKLSSEDYAYLSKIRISDFKAKGKDLPVVKGYKIFETALREELVLFRRQKREGHEHKMRFFSHALLKEKNPLEIEVGLLFLRWQHLDDLSVGHYFDLEFLALYFLKLQILERQFSFDREKGEKEYQRLAEVKL